MPISSTATYIKPSKPKTKRSPLLLNALSMLLLALLILMSLSLGVADFSWSGLWQAITQQSQSDDLQLLLVSRLPRTVAIILTGASLSVAGMILQVVLKNRFVDPSMVGATQSAGLGLLLISLYFPASTLLGKMLFATLCAIAGMFVFMRLIKYLPATDILMVPLVGIVFGGIIEAVTTFMAFQTESLQMLSIWRFGDFSSVLAGRYELLYLTGGLAFIAYLLADKLTIVGLGDAIATNLGVNKQSLIWFVILTVAMISSVVVVTVGAIPFVGLVVPNIISRMMGDRLRRSLPAVALLGASMVLLCDIIGRSINYPFEIPIATVFGVFGAAIFLWLLLRKPKPQPPINEGT
ncbi:ABC transporter permease [Psychrobacter sp. FDAARGOS_221]|uniref:ABC transporter permease n=1 Tax=Psychrobacter sp. FDAARGOS_221 TaxID=1975705 RepID=UPI000BB53AAC|nr:iron chelate uptake ABC transporter family permease subunit [Psychrobacter sp. FDAARGOS_221]PNK60095.1 iron ABC transporter permease [Psychrobacter sp. FDAARGOS_221]